MEINELAIQAEIEAAKVGVKDWEVWAAVHYAMTRNGSELPIHCFWVSGKNPKRTLTRPSMRLLERGDAIINEIGSLLDRLSRSSGASGICRSDRSGSSRADQSAAQKFSIE